MKRIAGGSKVVFAVAVAALAMSAPALAGTHIEKAFEVGDHAELSVDSALGSVEVTGTAGSQVKIVFDSKKKLEDSYGFSFEQDGSRVEVKVRKKGSLFRWFSWGGSGKARFVIEVPRDTEVDVDTAGGGIVVRQVRGAVHADTSGGGITVEQVQGSVDADTSGGAIRAQEIDGSMVADTSGGGIYVDGISGDLSADTSGGPIKVAGAGGHVDADTSGGGISVEFAAGNGRGGNLSTSGGGITVKVDPAVSLDIDASTSGGSVSSELELVTKGASRTSLRGKLGAGGELLHLRSSGGSIHILPL